MQEWKFPEEMQSLTPSCCGGSEGLAFVLVSLAPVVTLTIDGAVEALFASGALPVLLGSAFR